MGEQEEKIEEEELETSEEEDAEGDDTEDLETEDTAETEAALKKAEEEEESKPPADVPYPRFAEMVSKAKKGEEFESKLDQFKRLGADGYYQLYPDEKPEAEPKPEPDGILSVSEMANYRVTGGDYDGMTLSEVFEKDTLAGMDIYNTYRTEMEGKSVEQTRLREESEREVQVFISARAKEAFDKETDALTPEEVAQVEELSNAVTQWMVDTGRGGGNIEDGYYLMNRENFFDKAKTETLKGLIEALKTPGTPSISSTKTSTKDIGYSRFLSMDAKEVAVELDKLSDTDQAEFLKKAPPEVRKKFPSLPWDA